MRSTIAILFVISTVLWIPRVASATELGSALPSRLPQSSGAGGTYVVDPVDGDDGGAGSAADPWRSINHALAVVPLSGSVIRVRAGTFAAVGTTYAIVFDRQGDVADPITVEPAGDGPVRIRNGDLTRGTLGVWIHGASGLRLRGLDVLVTAQQSDISVNAVLVEESDRIELEGNSFQESGSVQVRGGASDGSVSEDVWLINNRFRPSGDDVFAQTTGLSYSPATYGGSKGSHYVYAGQVGDVSRGFEYLSGCERLVIVNNVFAGSTAGRHVELGPQSRGGFVVNNTFFGNHAGEVIGWDTGARYAGQGVEFFANLAPDVASSTRDNTVANNLFVDLDGHAVFGSGPSEGGNVVHTNMSWQVRNQLGWDGDPDDDFAEWWGASLLFSEGLGNFQGVNPRLRAPAAFDFSLVETSPARAVADRDLAYPVDARGAARDGTPDLGALEWVADPDPIPDPITGPELDTDPDTELDTDPDTELDTDPDRDTDPGPVVDPVPGPAEDEAVDAGPTDVAGTPDAPRSVRRPVVTVVRGVAWCAPGIWRSDFPVSLQFAWRRTGHRAGSPPIVGAHRRRHRISRRDLTKRLRCIVTATSSAGSTVGISTASRTIRSRDLRRP